MIQVEVNGIPVNVRMGSTVLQACEAAGIEIPRFCYHERLLVAGNCRICLIEIFGSPKPQAACALPVSVGIKIMTESPRAKKARESVREFVLHNHPLDCPICDQGGECDRQDETIVFGSDSSRGQGLHGEGIEAKRSVQESQWNPMVKAIMTRCIHCTRCIRFASEVAGVSDRGTSNRGNVTEVGMYVSKVRTSELSGNLVDLCPVGALTSKPYGFKARPWDLKSVETINPRDGLGTPIRLQGRGQDLLRVLPVENDQLNGGWIDDKSRYSIDGDSRETLTTCLMNGDQEISQDQAVDSLLHLRGIEQGQESRETSEVMILVHPGLPLEYQHGRLLLTRRLHKLGRKVVRNGNGGEEIFSGRSWRTPHEDRLEVGYRRDAVGHADFIVLAGVNLRIDSPLMNARVRERYLRDQVEVVNCGPSVDLTFPVRQLVSETLNPIELQRKDRQVFQRLMKAKRPRILYSGDSPLQESSRKGMMDLYGQRMRLGSVMKGWKGLNPLYKHSSSFGSMVSGRMIPERERNALEMTPRMMSRSKKLIKRMDLIVLGRDREDIGSRPRIQRLNGHTIHSPSYSYQMGSRVYLGCYHGLISSRADLSIPRPSWYDLCGHSLNMNGEVQQWVSLRGNHERAGEKSLIEKRLEGMNDLPIEMGWSYPEVMSPVWRRSSVWGQPLTSKKGLESLNGSPISSSSVPIQYDYYQGNHPVSRRSPRMKACSTHRDEVHRIMN